MAAEQLDLPDRGVEGEKVKRRPSRGMYVLPSLFTAGNIAAGYYAITQSIQGSPADHSYFDHAALAIGLAALLDGVDGFIARLTNTTSDFGRELDSLADVITFGVLPLAADPQLRENVVHGGIFACFLFLICGACRLARFNISINPQPRNPGKPGSKYFVGMPIPAGAGVVAAVVHCFDGSPVDNAWIAVVWLTLILFTGFLMVSNWRFWSAKEITSGGRQPFQVVALLAFIGALIAWKSEIMLMVMALGYLVSGVLARLAYSWAHRRRHPVVSGPA
jgi:CDP-diacylglycerol--serine O-phosphatidyltransferase